VLTRVRFGLAVIEAGVCGALTGKGVLATAVNVRLGARGDESDTPYLSIGFPFGSTTTTGAMLAARSAGSIVARSPVTTMMR